MEQQRDYTNTNTFEAFFKKRNSVKLINLIPDSWSFNFFFYIKIVILVMILANQFWSFRKKYGPRMTDHNAAKLLAHAPWRRWYRLRLQYWSD